MNCGSILKVTKSSSFFSSERVRGHAVLLAIVLWAFYAANLCHPGWCDWAGTMKGGDFVDEYVLGKIALERNGALLYDYQAQTQLSRRVIPGNDATYLPVYGPQVSLFYAWFAALPYLWGAALWMLCSAIIYAACCFAVWRTTPNLRQDGKIVAILAVAFPGFFNLIGFGQNSAIALAAFTIAYLAFRSRRSFLAGMALGILAFKPPLGVAAAVLFTLTFDWKVILGGIFTAAGQAGIAAMYYGKQALVDYFHTVQKLAQIAEALEPKPYQMYSLRSFWKMLLPWPHVAFFLYVVSAVAVLALLYRSWRSAAPLSVRYAIFLVATVLVDPHVFVYDLVVLAPAFLLIRDWMLSQSGLHQPERLKWLLYLSYSLPLFGPVFRDTHFQLAVLIFLLLLVSVFIETDRMQASVQSVHRTTSQFPTPTQIEGHA